MRALGRVLFLAIWVVSTARAQTSNYKIVFTSRQYRLVGRSYPQAWSMTLPARRRTPHLENECTPQEIRTETLPPNVRLPEKSEHWNYLTSVSPSPNGKF